MASEYWLVVSTGGMKLKRIRVQGTERKGPEWWSGGTNAGVTGAAGRSGRPVRAFTPKARRQMRWVWNALPWEELTRLTMITLTYPRDWRAVCPDGATLKRHLRAFRERWRRKWGASRGVWVVEYQPRLSRPLAERHAPHLHLYVDVPEGAKLTRDATDDRLVWEWARQAWWEIVGSGDKNHRWWGVHVRPCYYGRFGGGAENGKRVGDYLWRESGKLAQKQAAEGFEGVKWWDVWGMEPREAEAELTQDEFVMMRRPTRLLRDKVTGAKVRRPSGLDGLAVTNIDGRTVGTRLLPWAQEELADRESVA